MKLGIAGPMDLGLFKGILFPAGMTLPQGMGGSVISHLANGLWQRGWTLRLYTLSEEVAAPLCIEGERVRLWVGPYRPRGRMRDLMAAERHAVATMIRQDPPDLIHACWCYEFALGALASGIPTLVTAHDWAPTVLRHAGQDMPYRLGRLLLFGETLRHAPMLTACSPYLAERLQRWRRDPVAVIPNFLPTSCFLTDAAAGCRQEGGPRLLAINAGFGRLKNVPTLLRTFPRVRQALPQASLTLLGDGFGPGQAAEQWARERGLTMGVLFQGPVAATEVTRWCDQSDILVHPSREESFGMVLLEAMARGLPVVGGRESGAVPWVLDRGNAGMLTDITRPEPLAAAVIGLWRDEERRQRLARAGLHRCREHFSPEPVIRAWEKAYASRLAPGGAA